MDNLVGKTIGGFKIDQAIASGPTGQVFRGESTQGVRMAIKLIHPALSLYTKIEPYWNELQKIKQLSHPHITSPKSSAWTKSGRFFLTLPLLEGLDLDQVLSTHGKLPVPQVLLFAGQVCLALEAAHDQNIFHGAVKPHNIFLIPKDSPSAFSTRLLDFSTAHLLEVPRSNAVLPPGAPGMPEAAYLAPEQFSGTCTKASDIYSLGVVIYEALLGRRPFAGAYEEIAHQHQTVPLELPSTLPANLTKLLTKALAKAPEDRFASVQEVRESLETWAATQPPELTQAPLALFPKKKTNSGVNVQEPEKDQTDRVPFEKLNRTFDHDETNGDEIDPVLDTAKATEEPQKVATHKSRQSKEPKKNSADKIPEDPELAAIAEQATNQLRAEAVDDEPVAPPPQDRQPEPELMLMDDDEVVELPLERSVLAYVSDLSLKVPLLSQDHGSNGESLDDALDLFVNEAKTLSAALPPPIVNDRELANLAKVPVVEPEPAPQPNPLPMVNVAPLISPPPAEKSSFMSVVIAFVLGGVLVFGGYKLFGPKTVPAPPSSAATLTQGQVTEDDTIKPATEPIATKTDTPDEQSGSTPPTTAAADAAPSVATAAQDGAPSVAPEAGASATATADASPAGAGSTVTTPAVAVKKAIRKKRRIGAAKAKVTAPPTKRPKGANPPEKKVKKSSDWVDPFSQ